MKKRFLSIILCISMLFMSVPLSALAADIGAEFICSVNQIKDTPPEGYTGIFAEEHLALIEENPDGYYILMEDIELSDSFDPLCTDTAFTGVFEGNGHTISGLNVSRTDTVGTTQYLGLFGYINGARIADLAVEGKVSLHVGSFSYDINPDAGIGGIVGYATGNAIIDNCVSDVDVTVTMTNRMPYDYYGAGGIIGFYLGNNKTLTMSYCKNLGDVNAAWTDIGGILGYAEASNGTLNIMACHNLGDVTASFLYAGGIIGRTRYTGTSGAISISSCANEGNILAPNTVGGIAGNIVNSSNNSIIQDCLNIGSIEGTATGEPIEAAGIAGQIDGTITRCVNLTSVPTLPKCAIAGYMNKPEDITDCYWVNTSTTTTSWANSDQTGALALEDMKNQEMYPALTFDSVWIMLPGQKQPFPTALISPEFTDTYREQYIENTITFADASYKYSKIMEGSGAGSFASILENVFEDAHLDEMNGVWKGMEFAEGFANSGIDLENEYYALLADLTAGAYGSDIGADSTEANLLSTTSLALSALSSKFEAADTLKIEEKLKEVVKLSNSKNYSACGEVLEDILEKASKNWSLKDLSDNSEQLGNMFDLFAAAEEGLTDAQEIIEYSILCSAFPEMAYAMGDILKESATFSMNYDNEEGKKAYQVCSDFANKMAVYAENNSAAYYEAGAKTVSGMAASGLSSVYSIAVSKEIINANPVLAGVTDGFTFGMPLADALTKMDAITYNGRMISMAGTLASGMYDVVQEKYDAFAHSKSYDDAEALNLASEMYLNLQILACDYALGYSNAKAAAFWGLGEVFNKDDVAAAAQVQNYKNELVELKNHGEQIYIGKDGSINGFIALCPVTVLVTDYAGTEIAKLETGNKTTAKGYSSAFQLTGEDYEQKSSVFSPDEHKVKLIGEENGTMDLIAYSTKNGRVSTICYYEDVPIVKGETYTIDDVFLINEEGGVIEPDTEEVYAAFTDVADDAWYYDAVQWAVQNNITQGTSPTTFSPSMACDRAQVVTFLWRANGSPAPANTENKFTDVPEDAWYYDAVQWAVQNDITQGTSPTTFSPSMKCDRSQIVTFLWRDSGRPVPQNTENKFTDVSPDSWYYTPVLWAVENGITQGTGKTTFSPVMTCDRAQVVTFLSRIYNK